MTFSLDSYRSLIRTAVDMGFVTVPFRAESVKGPQLLLRHDVDFSLDMAVALGAVNYDLGVSGTFFILLRGHTYNPLARASIQRLHELQSLGQRLALHATDKASLGRDFETLRNQVELDHVFAWHNPSPAVIEKYRDVEVLDGLTNVYSRRFLDDALYYSDSNFGRSYEQLLAAFDRGHETVHLLVHPINWVAGGDSMLDVFEHAWPYLLREAEVDARTNRVYAEHLPDGMPDALLTEFSRRWREAAG